MSKYTDYDCAFEKINRKAKKRNSNKQDSIRKQRKAKNKQREKMLYDYQSD